eukprot:XP_014790109.1 PREDICTED: uncharacterized protein LOC106883570 [Octopus bimaculoides]
MPEHARGKKELLDCIQQQLINKMIQEKKNNKKSQELNCGVPELPETFDSIPHGWIIEALQLAKVSQPLVSAIERQAKTWYIILLLRSDKEQIELDCIRYQKGICRDDRQSRLLFVFSLNSHTCSQNTDHRNGSRSISYIFFVNELKL